MADVFMRFPGGKSKALTLSYDDAVEQDIRLIEIMKANGLKGTFNINTGLYAEEGKVYPEGQIHRRVPNLAIHLPASTAALFFSGNRRQARRYQRRARG